MERPFSSGFDVKEGRVDVEVVFFLNEAQAETLKFAVGTLNIEVSGPQVKCSGFALVPPVPSAADLAEEEKASEPTAKPKRKK